MTPKIEHCQLLPSVCPPTECSYEASVVAARTAIFWGYQHPFWFRGICVSLKWDLFGYLKKSYIVNSELFFFFFLHLKVFPFLLLIWSTHRNNVLLRKKRLPFSFRTLLFILSKLNRRFCVFQFEMNSRICAWKN